VPDRVSPDCLVSKKDKSMPNKKWLDWLVNGWVSRTDLRSGLADIDAIPSRLGWVLDTGND
jgi:hypothetical protein